MKFSIFLVAGAIPTAVLAAEEHLDVQTCLCSSKASSCHCDNTGKSVQVLPDPVPKCVAARDPKGDGDVPYPNNSCGLAQRDADIECVVSRGRLVKPLTDNRCGLAQERADIECSRRGTEGAVDDRVADSYTVAQKHAIRRMIPRRSEEINYSFGRWIGGTRAAVEENCGVHSTEHERADVNCSDRCGHQGKDCIASRTVEDLPSSSDWCGRSLRLARDCLVSRSPEGDLPGDLCGKRAEHCRVSRGIEHSWCSSAQKRAEHCIVSRGWNGYPWEVCDGADAKCIAAAKRELGYDLEVRRNSEPGNACDYSSRGGRRAVTPPHCMCPVEGGEAGAVVKRCRCGEESRDVATKYHCMCLTGDGDATAPCACNGDVAFLGEVQYEQ
ncbi:hypothetical protein V2A60_007013 [Cordyceps javanica]